MTSDLRFQTKKIHHSSNFGSGNSGAWTGPMAWPRFCRGFPSFPPVGSDGPPGFSVTASPSCKFLRLGFSPKRGDGWYMGWGLGGLGCIGVYRDLWINEGKVVVSWNILKLYVWPLLKYVGMLKQLVTWNSWGLLKTSFSINFGCQIVSHHQCDISAFSAFPAPKSAHQNIVWGTSSPSNGWRWNPRELHTHLVQDFASTMSLPILL